MESKQLSTMLMSINNIIVLGNYMNDIHMINRANELYHMNKSSIGNALEVVRNNYGVGSSNVYFASEVRHLDIFYEYDKFMSCLNEARHYLLIALSHARK